MLIPVGGKRGIGKFVLVDDEDFEKISNHKWYLDKFNYATSFISGRLIRMHRYLLKLKKGDGLQVDHINKNRLDNRKSNLRVVTTQQNSQNVSSRKRRSDIPSRFRGVSWKKKSRKWVAHVALNNISYHLGYFDCEHKANFVVTEWRKANMPFSVEK